MSTTEKTKTEKTRRSPLLFLAFALSASSAIWTAYSSWDLLDRHPMALVAGATYDILWMALIYVEWKNRVTGKKVSSFPGWAMLLPVVVLLTWHGHEAWGMAGAIAGPFLAIGTKILWHKAIDDSLDEIAITKGTARKEIDLLNTETDVILEKAEAQIRKEQAESDAEHKRTLAQKARVHELKMADLSHKAEEDRAASMHRADLLVSSVENQQFEKLIGIIERQQGAQTVPGEIVTPRPSALPHAANSGPKMLTVSVGAHDEPLTPAQENRRKLAALYYLVQDDFAKDGLKLSYTAFAAMTDATKMQISRCVNEFPRQAIEDIESYRSEMSDALKNAG